MRILCPWDFSGTNTGVGSHSLLQRIFLTQGSNPGLLYYRQNLYHLSHVETILHIISNGSQKPWSPPRTLPSKNPTLSLNRGCALRCSWDGLMSLLENPALSTAHSSSSWSQKLLCIPASAPRNLRACGWYFPTSHTFPPGCGLNSLHPDSAPESLS